MDTKLTGTKDTAIRKNLSREYYTDAKLFEKAKERIFYRSWLLVGHQSQLPNPGDYFTMTLIDQSLILMRGKDHRIRGFYNVCPHRGHQLIASEKGNEKLIICPYHAWSFKTDGSLRSARGLSQLAGFDSDTVCISQFKVELFCGFIFINLDDEARPMNEVYPEVSADLRRVVPDIDEYVFSYQHSRLIKGNWMVAAENYCECYHCPNAHPVSDLLDLEAMITETKTNSIVHRIRTQEDHIAYYLWPLSVIQAYPGATKTSELIVNTYQWIPVDVDHTIVHRAWFFKNSEPTPEQMQIIEENRATLFIEDINIIEAVQCGLKNRGYRPGPLIIDQQDTGTIYSENTIYDLQQLLLKALEK